MNSLIKRTVSAVMVAVLVTATAPMLYENESVYAETVQDKINKARKEKQAAQAAKTEAKGKMQDAMAQITKLDDEADVIRAELSAIDAIISEADAKIEAKEAEIAELEAQIAAEDAEFCERLRAMDENNAASYIDLLLNSQSLSDFVARVETIREITEHDQGIINRMVSLRDSVEASKNEVVAYRAEQQEARNLVQGKQDALNAKIAEKTSYMKALEKDVAKYEQMEKAAAAQEESLKASVSAGSSRGTVSSSGRIIYDGGVFCWPAPSYTYISSEFGYRIHPVYGTRKYHSGMDMAAPGGSPILAAANGTVRFAGWNGGYGYCVIIDHGNGIQTLYGHSSKLLVSKGQTVTRGQKIALVGTTGTSTGNHLHFEVLNNGTPTNPRPYLS
ncbi:MAG: hypothetical protein E7400_01405 [Ruminococcaceae bacterium]|nr:hypothetical protein [Oscillospiraceae bacterium]